jgi:outer membrane protein assembly factor BamB
MHSGFNPYEVLLRSDNADQLYRQWAARPGGSFGTSAVAFGGRVFVGASSGQLVALSQKTGGRLWSVSLDGPATTPAAARGFDPQPDPPGKVFVGTSPTARDGDGSVFAFDELGNRLWATSVTGGVSGSPAVVRGFDPQPDPPGRVLVLTTNGTLYLIASHDCSVVSSLSGLGVALGGPTQGLVERTAAVGDIDGDGHLEVAVGSDDGNLYMVDDVNERLVLRWSFQTGAATAGTPVFGRLEGGDPSRVLVVGNANGTSTWSTRSTSGPIPSGRPTSART